MTYLSLFTGAGGGDLGCQHLLGWNCRGYVEIENSCQKVIRQRIEDGLLEPAPIFGDIARFNSEGFSRAYKGLVDVITAGFPCQAWSTAASGRNKTSRDLWPETTTTICIVQPRQVLLENVSKKAIERARDDLEAAGYSCRCATISASSVGSGIERRRHWILAKSDHQEQPMCEIYDEVVVFKKVDKVAWWETDLTRTLGVSYGDANRMDRYKAIGNGQVPAVVEAAWKILSVETGG